MSQVSVSEATAFNIAWLTSQMVEHRHIRKTHMSSLGLGRGDLLRFKEACGWYHKEPAHFSGV